MKRMQFAATTVALTAMLLGAWASSAHAAQPLATDESDVVEPRNCEWDLFLMRGRANTQKAQGWATQVGCGVGGNTQVNVGFERARSDGIKADAVSLDGKTALVVRDGKSVGVAVSYGWVAERESSRSLQTSTTFVNLIFTKSFTDRLTGHANVGWLNDHAGDSGMTWNVAAELAVGGGLELVAEAFGDGGSKPWLGVGARYALSDRASLNASYTVLRETPQIKLTTVGIKLNF